MDIKPIKTEKAYYSTLEEIEHLFDSIPGTPEGDRLDILTTLVEAYEEERYPIPEPDPIEAIKYYMESRGLSKEDLEIYIGPPEVVDKVLDRKQQLTLDMIRRLHTGLGISAEILIQPYACREAA